MSASAVKAFQEKTSPYLFLVTRVSPDTVPAGTVGILTLSDAESVPAPAALTAFSLYRYVLLHAGVD